jgi:hypothetical protein
MRLITYVYWSCTPMLCWTIRLLRAWPSIRTTRAATRSAYATASRDGMAVAAAWDRVHPRLTHRAGWLDHDGPLPVIEGTLIRLQAGHLPGDRDPKPVWLWFSGTGAARARWTGCGRRRFDLEHTFRLFKQVLGWIAPKICDPAAADRWTWLIIACHAQLRLARPLAADLRRPWERPAPPGRLTPAGSAAGSGVVQPPIGSLYYIADLYRSAI